MTLKFFAKILQKSIYHFGIWNGIKITMELSLSHRRSDGLLAVWVPMLQRYVTVRKGTSDAQVLWQIFVDQEYDIDSAPHAEELRGRYDAIVRDGKQPIIVDCGANIGVTSLWFQRQFPLACIYAVEPEPRNFARLVENLRRDDNIVPVRAAIWHSPATLLIVDEVGEAWAFQTEETSSPPDADGCISGLSIEHFRKLSATGRILIVKIDIEGAERALFEKNTQWVDHTDLLMIELHDWRFPQQGTSQTFFKRIASLECDVLVKGRSLFVMRYDSQRAASPIMLDRTENVAS